MADDALAAELARIAERRAVVVAADLDADALNGVYAAMVRLARDDSARLLAAVEAVLELAGPSREIHYAPNGFPEQGMMRRVRCDVLREAITRELTGAHPGAQRGGGDSGA